MFDDLLLKKAYCNLFEKGLTGFPILLMVTHFDCHVVKMNKVFEIFVQKETRVSSYNFMTNNSVKRNPTTCYCS